MQRDAVDLLEAALEHLLLPVAVGRHQSVRGAAGGQLHGWIHPAHHFSRLLGDPSIFGGGLLADLPGTVHLVSEAPETHAMRLLETMRAAQVRIVSAAGMIAVFDEMARLLGPARAEVDGEHRLHAGLPAPADELVRPELIGLRAAPGKIEPPRPLLARSDAILPVVTGQEVASRVANERGAQLAGQREHITAKTLSVRCWMSGLEDAAVDAAAHVLDERSEDASVERRYREVAIDDDVTLQHVGRLSG